MINLLAVDSHIYEQFQVIAKLRQSVSLPISSKLFFFDCLEKIIPLQ